MAYPSGDGFEDDITPDEPQAPAAPAPVRPDPSGITPDPITPDAPPTDTVAPWRKSLAAVLRGASNIGGRILGGAAGGILGTPADVVAGPAGTVGGAVLGESIGGGLGSTVGEYLAEKLEGRKAVNPYEIAGEGALGAVPLPGASTLVRAAAAGGGLSAADTIVHRLGQAAEGDDVDLSHLPNEALSSGLWGAAGGGALHALGSAIRARMSGEATPAPPPPVTPGEPEAGILNPTLPAASARKVTRAGQIQGLDPSTFRSVRPGPAAPPVTPSVTPPAGRPTDVFDAVRQLELEGGPTANTPGQIARHAFETAPPRGTSTIATGNPELDRLLGGGAEPEPLGLPTRDVEGTEHYDITPPELKQAGLDLSGSSEQGDLAAPIANNASGDSAASLEALSRDEGMRGRGETFVKYDRTGQRTPLLGVDGVDYVARPGETYGVEGPQGFQVLDDRGGRVPPSAHLPAELRDAVAPEMYHGMNDLPSGPGETFDLGGETAPPETAPPPVHSEDADLWASMPPEMQDLYEKLQPAWAEHGAMEDRGLFGAPYQSNKFRESPEEFASRIGTEDPKMLMSGERKVRQLLDAMKDEAGSVNPGALVPLASGGVGALAGAALEPDHPLKGAITGGIAGTGLALALQHPQAAEALRYFGLFASPVTIGKKALGDVGAAINAAYEHAAGGDFDTAKSILSNFFSTQTVRDAIDHFKNADVRPEIEEAIGPTAGKVIGAPSRALGAITQAAQDAHMRAGLSPEEAAALTYSGEPTSAVGRAVVNAQREGGPLMRLAMPTAKVMTNIAEKNFQTMPGIGALPLLQKLARGEDIEPGEIAKLSAQQLAGFLIGAAAYARGSSQDQTPKGPMGLPEKLEHALMAPYAMTDAAGSAMGAAVHGKPNPKEGTGMRAYNAAKAAILRDLPIPTGADLDPRQWAAEFLPNGLQSLSTYAPSQYEQSDPLDALIAKIPMLNDILLTPKRSALRGPQ